ncbi:MAG: hypothetical protein DRH21_06990 [Deltaproteobacteria bacterium]|nr:MAG: hypothetical protein DRH21_06990 [Deltaproteobacteria bacterium]
MKILTLIVAIFAMCITEMFAQEYLIVTTVESVVPMGIGRSRMIIQTDSVNVDAFTTSRTDGKKSKQKDVSRSDAKIKSFDETKMLNFYSAVGINFQNIASNDAMISDKINKLAKDGWEMTFVTSACESDAGKGDGTGIFITRYIFKRD